MKKRLKKRIFKAEAEPIQVDGWTYGCAILFSLFFATSLLELHSAQMHNSGSDSVNVILLLLSETQNIKSFLVVGNDGCRRVV